MYVWNPINKSWVLKNILVKFLKNHFRNPKTYFSLTLTTKSMVVLETILVSRNQHKLMANSRNVSQIFPPKEIRIWFIMWCFQAENLYSCIQFISKWAEISKAMQPALKNLNSPLTFGDTIRNYSSCNWRLLVSSALTIT